MSNQCILYHGSPKIIQEPIWGFGNKRNDYGLGFYCTESLELAKEWACTQESSGYANQYVLNLQGLSMLNLNNGEYHILNWLAILLENRVFRISTEVANQGLGYIKEVFMPDYKIYDIIKGYRADDSYFAFANAFLNNTISLSQLEKAMVLGKLGEQIVIMSKNAFQNIEYMDSIVVEKDIYYPRKMARDIEAREKFRGERNNRVAMNETYLIDILREGWENDDTRLQRIVFG